MDRRSMVSDRVCNWPLVSWLAKRTNETREYVTVPRSSFFCRWRGGGAADDDRSDDNENNHHDGKGANTTIEMVPKSSKAVRKSFETVKKCSEKGQKCYETSAGGAAEKSIHGE